MSCNMSYIVAMATEASEMAHSNITEASEKLTNEAKKIQKERNELEEEKEQWEDNKKMLEKKSAFGPHVTLDVGGTRYKVSRATLTRNFPRSHMLSCMFSGLYPPDEKEEGGVFFIDRNGKVFEHVLEYLRIGSAAILPLRLHQEPQRSIMLYQIHEEAKYFQIPELMNDLRLIAGCDGITNLQQLLVPPASFARPGAYSCVISGQLKWKLDYGPSKNEEITTIGTYNLNYAYQRVRICFGGVKCNQINFNDGSRFRFCDVSGVTFHQCNFGPRFDFTGSIMCGVKFERCTGLVTNMIRFSEKQLMESDMEEELVAALRKAGCTYDENKETVTD